MEWACPDAPVFNTDKARALLAYLAVESGRPHRREHLAGLLWSDQPEEQALHNLRQTLTYLRKALNETACAALLITATRDALQLNPNVAVWVDVLAFGQALDAAYRHQGAGGGVNVRWLLRALDLFKAPFLDQFYLSGSPLFDDWAALVREDCTRRAVEGLAWLAEYYERRGEFSLARQAALRILKLTPWDEAAQAQVMRLLAVEGRWSAAQHQFTLLQRALDEQLAVQPTRETRELFEAIRAAASGGGAIAARFPAARHNLPAAFAPFIGRNAELDELSQRILDPACRLLTVLGAPGIGKSALALELARAQVGVFADGVFFVALAALEQAERLPTALAEALGLPFCDRLDPYAQLLDYLRPRRLLLVLDNFEHLLPMPRAAALLADILRQAPAVMLLVTSRERLNLSEEHLYQLDGLPCPGEVVLSQSPEEYDALALFACRARQVQQDFALGVDNLMAVTRICCLLEGLPLGIELAAAALFHSGPQRLSEAIEADMAVLTAAASNVDPRHRSLRAAFEVSWKLLGAGEQAVFAALSVFRGGFEAGMAHRVAGATDEALHGLVGRSLLRRSPAGRYDLLEPNRQAGAEKLAACPARLAQARGAHAACFAAWLAGQQAALQGAQQRAALAEVQREGENIRQAWDWMSAQRDGRALAGCAEALYQFFNIRSRFGEGIDVFQRALGALAESAATERERAVLAARLGALAYRARRGDLARQSVEMAHAVFERSGPPSELAFCLVTLGGLALRAKDYVAALARAAQAREIYTRQGDDSGQSYAHYLVGLIHSRQGRSQAARPALLAALDLARRGGDQRRLIAPLNLLGDLACGAGEYAAGERYFNESLALARALDDRFNQAIVVNNLATVSHIGGKFKQEQALLHESLTLCRDIGDRDGEAVALNNLGECFLAAGNAQAAVGYSLQALELARQVGEEWTVIVCLDTLGEAYTLLRDFPAAALYLRQALQLAHATQSFDLLARAAVHLGHWARCQGRRASAQRLYQAALAHFAIEEDYAAQARAGLAEMGLASEAAPDESLLAAAVALELAG